MGARKGKAQQRTTGRRRDSGVTLIEMMVVLVIIAIVASLIVPNVIGRPDEARVTVARTDVRTIAASLEMYRLDNLSYPSSGDGLQALVKAPAGTEATRYRAGGYIRKLPDDPWGNAYIYECPGKQNPSGYDLSSMGPDARAGTDDDITNWQQAKN